MEKLIVICGPTATGKTALGAALARTLDGEVVGADSMQVYRGMDIGTAKPTAAEMDGVVHHMIDVADPAEDFSVARYVELALPIVEDILRRGKRPIVVGGTGLYIDSLIAGQTFAAFDPARRRELEARARSEGLAALYAELGRVDPQRQRELHPNDEKRILRAPYRVQAFLRNVMEVAFDGTERFSQQERFEKLRDAYPDIGQICDPSKLPTEPRGQRSASPRHLFALYLLELALYFQQSDQRIARCDYCWRYFIPKTKKSHPVL